MRTQVFQPSLDVGPKVDSLIGPVSPPRLWDEEPATLRLVKCHQGPVCR